MARIAFVLNRASGMSHSEIERIEDSLGCEELFRLADGKTTIEALVGMGRIEELVEEGPAPLPDIELLLTKLLPRIGIEFPAIKRKKTRRFFT